MARRQKPTTTTANSTATKPATAPADLRERILADFAALRVPLTADQFDAILTRAQHEGLSHQHFLHLLIAEQAACRRQRSIAHRIKATRRPPC